MKFKNKIIVVCLCASVFAGGCGQGGQYTTKSKNEERFVGAGFHLVSEEVLVSCLNQKQIILT